MRQILLKGVLGLLSASLIQSVSAAPMLHDYADVLANLKRGNSVNVAVNLAQCSPLAGTEQSQSQAGMQIKAYRLTRSGDLSFADEHFAVTDDGRPIRQLIRFTVQKNNAVDVRVWMFRLPSYSLYQRPFAYSCHLDQGVDLNVAFSN